MILNKRIFREFKENIARYLGLILLVLISSMLIVGFADSADSIIFTGEKAALENNLEDGEFYVNDELNSIALEKIRALGVTIEENFYVDYKIYDNQTIRIYKERKNINKISITQGSDLSHENQIVIDSHFGKSNNYKILSGLTIQNKDYKIVGYGSAPDRTKILQKSSDILPNPKSFGIGFIKEEEFKSLKNVSYSYSYKLNGVSVDKVKNIVFNNSSITEFIKTSDNSRAIGYLDDSRSNKNISIIIGIVLNIMSGFMISMSSISSIEEESPIIGALYSLGYVKKEILRHFMILPTVIVSIGSIIGTGLGFFIEKSIGEATIKNYVLPNIEGIFPLYLIVVGVVVPIIIVFLINYFIISRKLNSTPLQLLKREKKASKLNTIKINFFSFVTKFRLREFLREIRGNIILFGGIFISTFLLIFGVSINSAINEYIKEVQKETQYSYMYTLKLPIEIVENNNLEKCTIKNLSFNFKDINRDMDITLEGINEKSNFYSFSIAEDDPGIYISDSVKNKFHLNIGDTINLKDKSENKIITLKINGIVDYKSSLNIFMNRVELNKLLKEDKAYFNGYLSNKELNINDDYVYSKTTAADTIKAAKSMTSGILPIVLILIVFSCVLFILSMYLLLKLMIDKSLSSISLVKIFGFNKKEINKLYLGSSFYTVFVSAMISIPLALKITRIIYPRAIANVQVYVSVILELKDYCFIIFVIMFSYFICMILLRRHISSISLSEALKNRD